MVRVRRRITSGMVTRYGAIARCGVVDRASEVVKLDSSSAFDGLPTRIRPNLFSDSSANFGKYIIIISWSVHDRWSMPKRDAL
jgi:hypothetical protein